MIEPLLQLLYSAVTEIRDGGIAEIELDQTIDTPDGELNIAITVRRDPKPPIVVYPTDVT